MFAIGRKFWHRLGTAGLVAAASVAALLIFAIVLTFVSGQSSANRQFQRETGKRCGFCHVPGNEPELGPEGKRFQACGYKFCTPPKPAPVAGGCPAGQITCGAWCDKYRENSHACKYTSSKNCVRQFGSVHSCLADQPPPD
jgi:hypothetical protein